MSEGVDVFVIGGGPAGLAAAIAARQQGFTVIVADGAEPPIDKPCGEGLMPDTLAALGDLGIHAQATDGFRLRGIRFVANERGVEASFPSGYGIGLRRVRLHERLIDRADCLGVTLLWNKCVTGISTDGVHLGNKTVSAKWIIGADGMRSRVRLWAGLQSFRKPRPRYAFRCHYRITPWSDCVEVYWGNHAQAYVTPVREQEVCVAVISRKPRIRLCAIPVEFPELARRLGDAPATKERGELSVTQSHARVHRGRIALIGDASGTVDAITGEGLCLAFLQAKALANAMRLNELNLYQLAHRQLMRRPTWMARSLLLLDRYPQLQRNVLHSLIRHPELFAQLLAVHDGSALPGQLARHGMRFGWRLLTAQPEA